MRSSRWMLLIALACLAVQPTWALDKAVPAINADASNQAQADINGIDGTGVKIGQIENDNPLATHPALVGHVTLVNNPAKLGDDTDHATGVAGVMVSQDPAHKGVAPGAQVFSFATDSTHAKTNSGFYIDAADALVAKDVSIINASAAVDPDNPIADSKRATLAVDWFAYNKNIIWVQAAGNGGPKAMSINAPGECFNCITVGRRSRCRDSTRLRDSVRKAPPATGATSPTSWLLGLKSRYP